MILTRHRDGPPETCDDTMGGSVPHLRVFYIYTTSPSHLTATDRRLPLSCITSSLQQVSLRSSVMKVLGVLLLTATMLVLAVDAVPRPHGDREGHHWAHNCSMDGSRSHVRDTGIKIIRGITQELCDGDADKTCSDKILLCLPEVKRQKLHELVNARDTLVANFMECAKDNDVTISDPQLLDRLSAGECDPTKSEESNESNESHEGSEESPCHHLHHGYKCIMDNLGISDDQVVQMALCFMKKMDLMSVLQDCMNKEE